MEPKKKTRLNSAMDSLQKVWEKVRETIEDYGATDNTIYSIVREGLPLHEHRDIKDGTSMEFIVLTFRRKQEDNLIHKISLLKIDRLMFKSEKAYRRRSEAYLCACWNILYAAACMHHGVCVELNEFWLPTLWNSPEAKEKFLHDREGEIEQTEN